VERNTLLDGRDGCTLFQLLLVTIHSGLANLRERQVFFFEKKKQKTFGLKSRVGVQGASGNKSFLLLFFKKEVLAYFTAPADASSGTTRGTF